LLTQLKTSVPNISFAVETKSLLKILELNGIIS